MSNQKYLLKGDVSGIQEFIFNVSSKNAAKSLKARSFFIQRISEWTLQRVKDTFPNSTTIYDGGGNFYVDLQNYSDDKLISVQNYANAQLKKTGLYILLAVEKYSDNNAFAKAWKKVNKKINLLKLKKLKTTTDNLFEPYPYNKELEYIWLNIIKNDKFTRTFFGNDLRQLFIDEDKKLRNGEETDLFKNIPVWKEKLYREAKEDFKEISEENTDEEIKPDTVISFVYLAEFARKRTGTAKLGILKMDVDNLHKLFEGFKTTKIAGDISEKYNEFFNKTIFEKINSYERDNNISEEKEYNLLKNNIYPVFSGGDDCFFVGAWDKMLDFAELIQKEFIRFRDEKIKKEPGFEEANNTLSASLSLVDAHFPVTRFAEIAEDRLSEAKKFPFYSEKKKEALKNAISFMGEVIEWENFYKISALSEILKQISEREPSARSFLYRITDSAKDFDILQNKAIKGQVKFPEIWRLFYTVKRNIKNNDNKELLETKVLNVYKDSVLEAYLKKQPQTSPTVFPLAARWAEFLTRKK